MRIYDFQDFRVYVKARVKAQAKGGRGELMRIAKHLGVHTTTLSQVIKGVRSLSAEQTHLLADYYGLNKAESKYLHLLVQLDRAGNARLRGFLKEQLVDLASQEQELVSLLKRDRVLAEEDKAIFYSNWFYSAARVLSSVPGTNTREAIAKHTGLPRKLVNEVIDFLVSRRLCLEEKGLLEPGPQYTHVEASSPLVARHHANWRLRAIDRHPKLTPAEFAYTSPLSISEKDAEKVRARLIEIVREVNETRAASEPEAAFCFNVDWIRL